MNWHHQIKALFFLSIISMLMLHNALPHVHHQHDTPAVADHHGDHHHGHDHHDSDEQSAEDDGKGFLHQFLLGNHVHTFHAHEFDTATKWKVEAAKDKLTPLVALFENCGVSPPHQEQNLHWHPWYKRIYFDDPLLRYSALRAPPSVG